jgi:hypothetical protein
VISAPKMDEAQLIDKLGCNFFTKVYPHFVCARDELSGIKIKDKYYIIIFNTSVRQDEGEHWICLISLPHYQYPVYFDSYGRMIKFPEIEDFMKKYTRVQYSSKQLQSLSSEICGEYCLTFASFACRGFTLEEFQNIFTDDTESNDKKLKALYDKEYQFLKPMCCKKGKEHKKCL